MEDSNFIRSIFDNQWVITIFGGLILSGIIKSIEIYVIKKKDNKDIKEGNQRVVRFLERVVINKTELSQELLETIMNASARLSNIKIEQMNSNLNMIEDTIFNIYEIQHLPVPDKDEIIKMLLKFKTTLKQEAKTKEFNKNIREERGKGKLEMTSNILLEFLPIYLASVLVIALLLFFFEENIYSDYFFMSLEDPFIGTILILIIIITTSSSLLLGFKVKEKNRRNREIRRKTKDIERIKFSNQEKSESKSN